MKKKIPAILLTLCMLTNVICVFGPVAFAAGFTLRPAANGAGSGSDASPVMTDEDPENTAEDTSSSASDIDLSDGSSDPAGEPEAAAPNSDSTDVSGTDLSGDVSGPAADEDPENTANNDSSNVLGTAPANGSSDPANEARATAAGGEFRPVVNADGSLLQDAYKKDIVDELRQGAMENVAMAFRWEDISEASLQAVNTKLSELTELSTVRIDYGMLYHIEAIEVTDQICSGFKADIKPVVVFKDADNVQIGDPLEITLKENCEVRVKIPVPKSFARENMYAHVLHKTEDIGLFPIFDRGAALGQPYIYVYTTSFSPFAVDGISNDTVYQEMSAKPGQSKVSASLTDTEKTIAQTIADGVSGISEPASIHIGNIQNIELQKKILHTLTYDDTDNIDAAEILLDYEVAEISLQEGALTSFRVDVTPRLVLRDSSGVVVEVPGMSGEAALAGQMTFPIPLPDSFAGSYNCARVTHICNDGTEEDLETFPVKGNPGAYYITVTTFGFSPFIVTGESAIPPAPAPAAPAPAPVSTVPKTGDPAAGTVWSILALLSVCGLCAVGFGSKKLQKK